MTAFSSFKVVDIMAAAVIVLPKATVASGDSPWTFCASLTMFVVIAARALIVPSFAVALTIYLPFVYPTPKKPVFNFICPNLFACSKIKNFLFI